MKNKQNVSVWLIAQDGENKGKIALQRRSFRERNFPYVCQATWSGKLEEGESIEQAVKRECVEELGKKFAESFNFSGLKFFKKESFKRGDINWICSNFIGGINSSLLEKTKLHRDAFDKFVFVGANDKIYPIKSGQDPKKEIVLFDDQYNIIKQILNGN